MLAHSVACIVRKLDDGAHLVQLCRTLGEQGKDWDYTEHLDTPTGTSVFSFARRDAAGTLRLHAVHMKSVKLV